MNLMWEIARGIWMMPKQYADVHMHQALAVLNGQKIDTHDTKSQNTGFQFAYDYTQSSGGYTISEWGNYNKPEDAPEGSVAIINITGTMTKYDGYCNAGMITKSNLLMRAAANSRIKGIIIKYDTGGGETYAAKLLSDTTRKVNEIKPVMAFIDDMCASAGVYAASAAKYVVANHNQARIGSIGTYVQIADYKKFWEMQGIELTEIYADASVDKNKGYYDALNGDFTLIKKSLNEANDMFINDLMSNRGESLKTDKEEWGTGKMFNAKEAKKLGLIDGIIDFNGAIQTMLTLK